MQFQRTWKQINEPTKTFLKADLIEWIVFAIIVILVAISGFQNPMM